ncbi:hypothetical protein GGI12_005978 [Dipsacomyces acuminosporus]|nr:hypothetical protein GGI12_005978 [Dipsacomyces acuminosporus]
MEVASHVFNASRKGQKLVANIYTPASRAAGQGRCITLLVTHANGFHKEIWEPALQRLFEYQGKGWFIDRAIALDGYNHGDSAVINRTSIKDETVSLWFENARDIVGVVRQLGSPRNIVGLGHSWGASSLLLAEIISPLTFASLIITDPVLFPEVQRKVPVADVTLKRPCEWDSMEKARAYFEPHPFFRVWDKRILDLHLKYGLERLEDSGRVVLKCRPINEAAVFKGSVYTSPFAMNNLWKVRCPTAFLTGETSPVAHPDYIAKIIKPMADVRHVVMEGAGHLLVHEQPDQTADIYAQLLDGLAPKIVVPAKL